MGRVLNFPSNTVAADVMRNHLAEQVQELESMYIILDSLHAKMNDLEKECHDMEFKYDVELSRYADKVGSENVEVDFLQYTTRHIVSVDADGKNFTLTLQADLFDED